MQTPGRSMKSLICYIFPWTGKRGQWMPAAIATMRFFFSSCLLMLSGTTHFTLILWIERRLGAGEWGNGSEKKNGRNVVLHVWEIISTQLWVHFLKNVRHRDTACSQMPLCSPLISVVKFYSSEVLGVESSPHLICCAALLLLFWIH